MKCYELNLFVQMLSYYYTHILDYRLRHNSVRSEQYMRLHIDNIHLYENIEKKKFVLAKCEERNCHLGFILWIWFA